MVKVREDSPIDASGRIDKAQFVERLIQVAGLPQSKSAILLAALDVSADLEQLQGDQLTGWGEGYTSFKAGLEMADILAQLHLDEDTLVAAILYRACRENKLSQDRVGEQFGQTVVSLIEGVKKMAIISELSNKTGEKVLGQDALSHADKVRKMLVAMVDDVRVALIKLAERTSAIRAVKQAPIEKRQRVAREVAEIYAPLAHRLGIGHIKWELEDLAFRYLQPYDYKYIAKLLDERRLDRQTYIDGVISMLKQALAEQSIGYVDISGRAKHIYSIWRKMYRKGIGFEEVYDIRAVRIIVNTDQDCYRVLGIVHSLWHSIPGEFDDYIANPKENGYRSLHTAVKGPAQRVLEIQIRTHKMHEDAELGVCAHWRYKNSDKPNGSAGYEQKIAWLREVLEWHDEIGGNTLNDIPLEIEQDRIYVFTPDGHVVDLPERATPLDFAFRIHSTIGLRCRGAKVNGRIVPLNRELKTADQVEILTANRENPSRDWLNPALGYLTTSRARSRLQAWFRAQDRDLNIDQGRALLDKEFLRLALGNLDYEQLANKLHLKSLDDLYAAVGTGDMSVDRVVQAAQRLFNPDKTAMPAISLVGRATREGNPESADVYIDGVGNLLSYIAKCCMPVPGDLIAGYITQGRGVAIHRQDCTNFMHHAGEEPQRIIKVDWAAKPELVYSVVIQIEAFDRHGLLRDITALLDREKVNVSALQTQSDKMRNTVDMSIEVEVASFSVLSRLLAKLTQMPNVTSVRRKQ